MNFWKGLSKLSIGQFSTLTILFQLLPILIFLLIYGFNNCISYGKHEVCVYGNSPYGLMLPYINYFIFIGVGIINSIYASTKSELLTSSMNIVLIIYIWSDTRYSFDLMPTEYLIFLFCLILTLPIRLMLKRGFERND